MLKNLSPRLISPRFIFAAIGLICIGLLVTAAYLQYGPDQQQPCPLCILQRYCYLLLALVCLMAAAHGPRPGGTLVYIAITEILAMGGAGLAFWQVNKGASMTSCLADPIGEFVNGLPSASWWPEFLFANGGCADKYPPVFGLPVPLWSLIWFLIFSGLTTLVLLRVLQRNRLLQPRAGF